MFCVLLKKNGKYAMATVNYYLNNKENSKGEKLILIYFRYNKKQVVISTNELINPNHWDAKNQRTTAKHLGYSELNNNLNRYRAALLEGFQNRKYHKLSLAPADLKAEFEKIVKPDLFPEPAEIEANTFGLCAFMADQIKSLNYVKHEKTLSTYNRNLAIMLEFEKVVWKRKILFTDIDIEFYHKWKEFVIENYEFCNNTINKHTGLLKLFMGEAADKSLHQNFLYKSSKFSTPRNDVDSIYLSIDEINKLLSLDLSTNERLEKVRDLFVIGCWTGLRFSDLSNLRDENISKNLDIIHISDVIKTGTILDIPIHPIVAEILKKYKEKTGSYIPVSISNQKMNDYLKEIGELVEFTEEVSQVKKMGNKRIQSKAKKFELITCHTARRSFATNQYLDGVPAYEIMAITGHRTEKAFLSYIKVTQRQFAKKLGERWKNKSI